MADFAYGILTEGIKYAGSKQKLIPYVLQLLGELKGVNKVLDGFSGSTRVSQALAQKGYQTTSNDVALWSEVFATCYLKSTQSDAYYQELIDHLNALQGTDGWFTQHYGGDVADTKKPFQKKNTRRLDAIRTEIDRLALSWEDRSVLLTSLIYALDKVDNTLGHYVAYLTNWSKRSYNDLHMKLPRRFRYKAENRVFRKDIFELIREEEFDFVYLDPPYGSNNEKMPPSRVRYNAYYHLWTTVILNDQPDIFGKAGRREDSRDTVSASVFEEFRKDAAGGFMALNALDQLIKETRSPYILLSYSSGGRATRNELQDIILRHGKLVKALEIDHKRNVMSHLRWTHEWAAVENKHSEFLFLMEK